MLKKKNKTWIWAIGIVSLAILGYLYFQPRPYAILSPEPKYLTQYAGKPAFYGSFKWMEKHPFSLDYNNIAIIGDYKIITEKKTSGQKLGEPHCQVCSGTQISIDNNGCPIYETIQSTTFEHNLGCIGATEAKCESFEDSLSGECVSCSAYNAKDENCDCDGNIVKYSGCINTGGSGTFCSTLKCDVTYKVKCGGLVQNVLYEGEGCWSKADVYYKEQKIKEIDWDNKRKAGLNFLNGQEIQKSTDSDLHMDLHTDSQYFSSTVYWQDEGGGNLYADKGCYTIVNDYIFKLPSESFILNISAIEEQVSIKVNVSIKNYYKEIKGKIFVDFEVPTVVGSAKKTEEKTLVLPLGQSDYIFEVLTTDKVYVTPRVDFLMEGSQFQGVNYICYGQEIQKDKALSSCEYVKVGEIREKTLAITIMPNEVDCRDYGCSEGYTCTKTAESNYICQKESLFNQIINFIKSIFLKILFRT